MIDIINVNKKKRIKIKNKIVSLYVGVNLLIQSATFILLFVILFIKKKSLSSAFFAIGSISGLTGTFILLTSMLSNKENLNEDFWEIKNLIKKKRKENESRFNHFDVDFSENENNIKNIPVDDTVNEDEFK